MPLPGKQGTSSSPPRRLGSNSPQTPRIVLLERKIRPSGPAPAGPNIRPQVQKHKAPDSRESRARVKTLAGPALVLLVVAPVQGRLVAAVVAVVLAGLVAAAGTVRAAIASLAK